MAAQELFWTRNKIMENSTSAHVENRRLHAHDRKVK